MPYAARAQESAIPTPVPHNGGGIAKMLRLASIGND
jgi:hypothetical protein